MINNKKKAPFPQPQLHITDTVVFFLLLGAGQQHLEALMGKAKYMMDVKQDFKAALAAVQMALVHFPTFIPALIEKSKIELASSGEFWANQGQ